MKRLGWQRRPGGALGHFCATADPGTPMPVDPAIFAPFATGAIPEVEPRVDTDLGAQSENPAEIVATFGDEQFKVG